MYSVINIQWCIQFTFSWDWAPSCNIQLQFTADFVVSADDWVKKGAHHWGSSKYNECCSSQKSWALWNNLMSSTVITNLNYGKQAIPPLASTLLADSHFSTDTNLWCHFSVEQVTLWYIIKCHLFSYHVSLGLKIQRDNDVETLNTTAIYPMKLNVVRLPS